MKPSDCSELALFDVSPPSAAMEASLAAALGGARRRRIRRASARTVPALAVLACATIAVWLKAEKQTAMVETPAGIYPVAVQEEARPYALVRSSGDRLKVVTSGAQGWSAPRASAAVTVVRTSETAPAKHATDTELLAAAGPRPAALCRFPDGASRLVVVNAAAPQ